MLSKDEAPKPQKTNIILQIIEGNFQLQEKIFFGYPLIVTRRNKVEEKREIKDDGDYSILEMINR